MRIAATTKRGSRDGAGDFGMTAYLVRGVLFGLVMGAVYYFGFYRKRPDRLKASLRFAVMSGAFYGVLIYLLDLFVA